MSPRTVGWTLVVVQFVLLLTLIALPRRDDFPTPIGAEIVAWALIAAGVVVALVATRGLGTALTPTPEPRDGEQLRTDGLYRYVRHPIYSGLLLAIVGIVVRSGSWATLTVGVTTVAFFTGKATWEERRLTARYADYPEYARAVGRFVPRRLR